MKCHDIQKNLYLYRAGELDEKELKLLKLHLETCVSCRAEYQAILEIDSIVQSFRKVPKDLQGQEALTQNIMASIRAQQRAKSSANSFRQKHVLSLTRPWQWALTGALCAIILFVLVQEALILRRVANLEEKTQHQARQTISEPAMATLLRHAKIGQDGTIVIDREVFRSILRSMERLQIENKLLLQALIEQSDSVSVRFRLKDLDPEWLDSRQSLPADQSIERL